VRRAAGPLFAIRFCSFRLQAEVNTSKYFSAPPVLNRTTVSPADPVRFGVTVLVLARTAFGAAWVPAQRAMRVDPMVALRAD
jgi:ABC-type lipoprotein release transport system permease subunit